MAADYIRTYSKGTVLFKSGDAAKAVYFILEGTVVVSRGKSQTTLGQGGIVGDVAFFQEGNHTYAAVCVTDLRALEITGSNIKAILAARPILACSLLRELAHCIDPQAGMVFLHGSQVPEAKPGAEQTLPPGHPVFSQRVPAEHREFLFDTNVECPICGTAFSALRTRVSRLRLKEQRADFRMLYYDFEPIFYYIWVCPNCQFAYPERQYGKLAERTIQRIRKAYEKKPPGPPFTFDGQRTLDQVISSYYLALGTLATVKAKPDLRANLWLRMLWMYEDLEESELALYAAGQARQYFSESLSAAVRSAAGDQQLYLVLGELDLRLDQSGDAFRNFHSAATMTTGDPRYRRMAADRIQDLRMERQG